MNCPICNIPLTMSDRQGVEIDYCPKCRGIWLDRGELEKLIERSNSYEAGYGKDRYSDYEHHDQKHHAKYKRRSFLSEFFD